MCSLTDPWQLVGGSLVDCRCGSRLFFSCSRSGKTAFGRLRTDQSPQQMHYLCYLMLSWSDFPLHALLFNICSEKCSPPFVNRTILHQTYNFLDAQDEGKTAIVITVPVPVAPLLVRLVFFAP